MEFVCLCVFVCLRVGRGVCLQLGVSTFCWRLGRSLNSIPFSLWVALGLDTMDSCDPKQLTLTAKSQWPQAHINSRHHFFSHS